MPLINKISIVTTTAVTGATPAALYAHSSHRDWQCDTAMKNETNEDIALCKDIAVQLIEDDTGKNINVILGGGRNPLGANLIGDEKDACVRNDGRNLAYEWLKQKKLANKTATYVTNSKQLDDFDPKSVDYLLEIII
ncbi:hypothetical protein Avbf_03077 [Armadillidium vulgare]|nr:hypothetical protein Avbf_03077 [Armadillidium vulgare]